MNEPKLTTAQLRELKELSVRDARSYYSDGYKPIQRLHELGYVDYQQLRYSGTYAITPAGLAALSKAKGPTI